MEHNWCMLLPNAIVNNLKLQIVIENYITADSKTQLNKQPWNGVSISFAQLQISFFFMC